MNYKERAGIPALFFYQKREKPWTLFDKYFNYVQNSTVSA